MLVNCVSVPQQETKLEEEKKRAEEAQTNKRKDIDELKSLKRAKEDMNNEMEELRETISQVRSYSPPFPFFFFSHSFQILGPHRQSVIPVKPLDRKIIGFGPTLGTGLRNHQSARRVQIRTGVACAAIILGLESMEDNSKWKRKHWWKYVHNPCPETLKTYPWTPYEFTDQRVKTKQPFHTLCQSWPPWSRRNRNSLHSLVTDIPPL